MNHKKTSRPPSAQANQQTLQLAFLQRLILVVGPGREEWSRIFQEWRDVWGVPVAWVELDEAQNQPEYLLDAMVQSLAAILPDPGTDLAVDPAGPIEEGITDMINSLAHCRTDFFLVLSDYHYVDEAAIHKAIQILIEYIPPAMHLILTSAGTPPLEIAHLRVRRQLLELE